MDTLEYNILRSRKFKLKLNSQLPNFSVINELFLFNKIKFKTFAIAKLDKLEEFEMSFGYGCNFLEIYILAYALKEFGLEKIYFNEEPHPDSENYTEIIIGSNWHRFDNSKSIHVPSRSVEEVLKMDPNTPTLNIIKE